MTAWGETSTVTLTGKVPPEKRFNVLHDIYSIGVAFLQIGLWRSSVGFEKNYYEMDADQIMHSLWKHGEDRLPHYMRVDLTEAVLTDLDGSLFPEHTHAGLTDAQRLQLNLSLFERVLRRTGWKGDELANAENGV
ncbi:hypothetical protein ACJZ2D_016270 [Fusarium nematophilum]